MIVDLFASAAEAEALPPSHWTRPVDAGDDWCTFLGPHKDWDAFRLATQPWEDIPVHRGKDGFRASVTVGRDRTTGLWVFGIDADGPVSSSGGPPGYDHGAYPSRDAALSVGRAKALERMAKHAKTYTDHLLSERQKNAAP